MNDLSKANHNNLITLLPESWVRKGKSGAYYYQLNNIQVWTCIHNSRLKWAVAEIINNRVQNHKYYEDLQEAFNDAENRTRYYI